MAPNRSSRYPVPVAAASSKSSCLAKGNTGTATSRKPRHVQFIAYSAAKVMPALASRAARNNLGLDDY